MPATETLVCSCCGTDFERYAAGVASLTDARSAATPRSKARDPRMDDQPAGGMSHGGRVGAVGCLRGKLAHGGQHPLVLHRAIDGDLTLLLDATDRRRL